MANKLYEESHIRNIANAIRGKTGKTDLMTVSQMAGEIEGISGGGSGKIITFSESSFTLPKSIKSAELYIEKNAPTFTIGATNFEVNEDAN